MGMRPRHGSARGGPRPVAGSRRQARTRAFWAAIGAAVVIALVVLAVLVDSVAYHNKVHAGVIVAGVDLGGKTKAEAMAALSAVVEKAQAKRVTVTAGEQSWTLSAQDAGAVVDVEGAVKAAMAVTREHDLFTDIGIRWKLLFARREVPLTGSVDDAKVSAFVTGIAGKVDVAPVDAALTIKGGQIEAVASAAGNVVDQAALSASLKAEFVGRHGGVVEVPLVTKEPEVTAEDNAEAKLQAETMISGPVTVTAGDDTWTVSADEIVASMSFRSEAKAGVSTLVPFMDAGKLQSLLDDIAPKVLEKAKDASFTHTESRVSVVPGTNGRQLDADATTAAITAATLKATGRTVKVVTKVLEPGLTTAEAKAMGITTKLNSYSTTYACDGDRQANVKLATKNGTDVFLAPGEAYDFDKQIGPRTASRGWHMAPGITGPNQLEDVLGGGICQVSTTMFNAVAGGATGLKVTERHNHSLFISHYPLGRDATVTVGGKDLRFVNDMDHYVWITGTSNGITTTITVWGTDQGRSTNWTIGAAYGKVAMTKTTITDPKLKAGKTSLVQKGQPGQSIKTTRVVTENGKVIDKNVWVNTWVMYPEETAIGTATTSTTHPPSTGTTHPPTTGTTSTSTTSTTALAP